VIKFESLVSRHHVKLGSKILLTVQDQVGEILHCHLMVKIQFEEWTDLYHGFFLVRAP